MTREEGSARKRTGEGRRSTWTAGSLKLKKQKMTHHAPILIASSDRHSVKQRAALILKSQCPGLFTV